MKRYTWLFHYDKAKAERKVYKLLKSRYGLKQASRQWFSKFSEALLSFGFVASLNDYSMFTYSAQSELFITLVYVDDAVIIDSLITRVKEFLHAKFSIKDLGPIHYFLGIEVARSSTCLFINQRKYAFNMIYEAGLTGCEPSPIPMDHRHKLALSTTPLLANPSSYQRLVGQLIYLTVTKPYLAYFVHTLSQFMNQLIYLTVTRPDLAYFVHTLSQFMSSPTEDDQQAAYKVLHYLKMRQLKGCFIRLISNWLCPLIVTRIGAHAQLPLTRRSVTGYAIMLGKSLVSWKTKNQDVISSSYTEAEYRSMAHTFRELTCLDRRPKDLQVAPQSSISLFCDNQVALHIARNPIFHERTNQVEISILFGSLFHLGSSIHNLFLRRIKRRIYLRRVCRLNRWLVYHPTWTFVIFYTCWACGGVEKNHCSEKTKLRREKGFIDPNSIQNDIDLFAEGEEGDNYT